MDQRNYGRSDKKYKDETIQFNEVVRVSNVPKPIFKLHLKELNTHQREPTSMSRRKGFTKETVMVFIDKNKSI